MSPSDCKVLCELIFQKTRNRLSETTLKRVYGFANSDFKPSQFTLDTLLQYCGYSNWDNFIKDHDSKAESDKTLSWLTLNEHAYKLTHLSLRALKGRSGIPYIKTIKRKFINDHMDGFLASDDIATAIMAPSGYGKTIALLHWIEERHELNVLTGRQDIILLFSTATLQSVLLGGQDIYVWLLALLGFDRTDDLVTLLTNKENDEGKFFLIIDGFDDHAFKADQFQLIVNQLVDILSVYELSNSFRLVLSMTSATWLNNKHHFYAGTQKWFTGFISDPENGINVPLFYLHEIQELHNKINHEQRPFIHPALIDMMSNPLYYQIYYKLSKGDELLSHVDALLKYDMIAALVLDKIYLDKYAVERLALIFELIQVMSSKTGQYQVNRLNANAIINKYPVVYQELISLGFLTELNKSDELLYNTCIEFGRPEFLDYMLAQKLLSDNNNRLNSNLVVQVNLISNSDVKLNVIKWIVMYSLKTEQQHSLNYITKTDLSLNQKVELITFIGDIFDRELAAADNKVITRQYFKLNIDNQLFYYFFGLEYIDITYEKALLALLKFDLPNDKKMLVLCSLSIIAITRLDMKSLETHLLSLKNISQIDIFKFPINPVKSINTIFNYLKYGIVKKDAFAEITRFCFDPPGPGEWFNDTVTNDITYILATFTLQLSRNPIKQLRFINLLKRNYKDFTRQMGSYSFFLNLAAADACFIMDDKVKMLACYRSVLKIYHARNQVYTPFMRALFHGLKIKMLLANHQYEEIDIEFNYFDQIAYAHKFKLSKFYIVTLLLKKSNLVAMIEKGAFYKKLHYEHSRLMIEGAVVELFEKQEI
ncbi:hypothetical protein [Mucilaginibacter pineti]|uniref:hypothetical protein n=1 Tax=Mucilaginibacter pineti TaxID=1391627 RepID=UPI00115F8D48|nr:hypothetical protein [Mucilaginibacter pineti]